MAMGGASAASTELDTLRERLKELRALHAVAVAAADTGAALEGLLRMIAADLVPAMQWPQRAVARVGVGRICATSAGWRAPGAELFAYG
ncbi:MAG TPA: hypothetical protein PK095_09115, partial [Myxococcota bacterium]|nr:hypothetical protein [Myxococcota bacterium]